MKQKQVVDKTSLIRLREKRFPLFSFVVVRPMPTAEEMSCFQTLSSVLIQAHASVDAAERNPDAVTTSEAQLDDLQLMLDRALGQANKPTVVLDFASKSSGASAAALCLLKDGVLVRKAEQMAAEVKSLRLSLLRANGRHDRQREAIRQRDELIKLAKPPSSSNDDRDGAGWSEASQHTEKERAGLDHTRREIQRLSSENAAVLEALKSQRSRLSNTGDRLEGVLQSLGLSNQAIAQIKKRTSGDVLIVCIGAAAVVMLMGYIWFA